MDKIFEQALLYDFYGELLTPHQRSIYEDVVFNDMSLGEIAKEQGISRQGVHDLMKRCDKILQDYEAKLHLVERFSNAKEKIGEIVELTKADMPAGAGKDGSDVSAIAGNCADEEILTEAHSGCCRSDSEQMSVMEKMQRIRELAREIMKEL